MLRAGDLRHRVTVHAPAGTKAVAAVDVAPRVPAKIAPLLPTGREALEDGGVQSQIGCIVTMRYRTDVQASYLLIEHCCTERRLQIQSITPSEDGRAIQMNCVTVG